MAKMNELMCFHTSMKVGGPAYLFEEPETEKELKEILAQIKAVGKDFYVCGNGSNLLVSDKGYNGTLICLGKQFNGMEVEGNYIYAEAGESLASLAHMAREHGLTGLEFASGIPGTVGGAVVMNAGAYDGEIKDVLVSVALMDKDGNIIVEDASKLDLGYRHSNIPERELIVVSAVFALEYGDKDAITAKMNELNARRKEKQPLEYPSCGSMFKRPEGYFAGKLIQDAGLAGYSIGGAKVSEKHCGFVINTGEATAQDVYDLTCHIIKTVEEKFGVTLEREVKLLGEF